MRLWLGLAVLLAGCGREAAEQPQPAAAAPRFERVSADDVRHGERLARVLGCAGCHGADLRGELWIDDPQDVVLWTSNLPRALPDYDDAALDRAIRAGIRADGTPLWGMPSELFTHLSEADVAALIRFLRTLEPAGEMHPRPVFGPGSRRMIESGEWRPAPEEVRLGRNRGPPALGSEHEWARYMVRATCSECHGLDLTAAPDPDADRPPPDLIVVGGYSREQFRHLMRTGEPIGGRELRMMGEVARGRFAHLTGREVDAVYDYLVARARLPQ